MENPLALVLQESHDDLDALFRNTFQYFQSFFEARPDADVCKINLLSLDWPEALLQDRRLTGAAFNGVLVAMLDHKIHAGNLADVLLALPILPELKDALDEVIIEQGAIAGDQLLASDLVLQRVCEWRRAEPVKYRRWQKALDKAFRIDQQQMAAPLDDPLLKEAKQAVVPQLRPIMARLQERFSKERILPGDRNRSAGERLNDEIVKAFAEEAKNPDVPFLNLPHNHELWLRFWRRDPVGYLHLSAERLFDEFTGFVRMHTAEYVRQKISRLK